MRKHDLKEIPEWFNTIIYCLSAESKRVEKFETDMIRSLLNDKNNLVVALTHSPSPNLTDNEGMVRELTDKTDISRNRIINICSVNGETIVGTKFEQFGKDEIFGAIVDNLWRSISGKLPRNIKEEIFQDLERKRKECINDVKQKVTFGKAIIDKVKFSKRFSASETMEEFGKQISEDIEKFIEKANKQIHNKLQEANDYYLRLFGCYNNQISIQQQRKIHVKVECSFFKDYKYDLSGIITFSDLKKIGIANLIKLDGKTFSYQLHAIGERIKDNWMTVKNKRVLAIKTINDCFDELKKEFNGEINRKLININDIYMVAID